MIVASRIPGLSEQLRRATIAAAQKQTTARSEAAVTQMSSMPKRRILKRFGLMGYRVVLEERAA
jgi:hypothetical protein